MTKLAILYGIVWQVAWWLGFLPALGPHPALGAIGPLVVVAVHLTWRCPPRSLAVVVAAFAMSVLVDGSLALLGLVSYARELVPEPWPALWISASWMLFACGLQRTMEWLRGRWILATVIGAILGPVAYFGATAFGPIQFIGGLVPALLGVSCGYAIALPVLTYVAFGALNKDGSSSSALRREVARA